MVWVVKIFVEIKISNNSQYYFKCMYLKLMFNQKWQLFSHLFTHILFHKCLSSVENERRIYFKWEWPNSSWSH